MGWSQDFEMKSVLKVLLNGFWMGFKDGALYAMFSSWVQEEVWDLESSTRSSTSEVLWVCEESWESEVEVTYEMKEFWEHMRVYFKRGSSIEELILDCKIGRAWSPEDQLHLGASLKHEEPLHPHGLTWLG